jgi:hydrogenase nickel incorporation protein HypA/HybF
MPAAHDESFAIWEKGIIEKGGIQIHELAVTEAVLNIVLKYAAENQAARVVNIRLQAGGLRDLTEEWIQRYFDYLSKETIAEGAKIILVRLPVTLTCRTCLNSFNVDIRQDNVKCPACGSTDTELSGGNEFLIESIEVI